MRQSVILKVTSLLLFICSVTFTNTYAQEVRAIFCGKSERQSAITVDELKNCDWKISVSDSAYVISSFKLSVILKDTVNGYREYEGVGNIIDEKYRNSVLNSKKIILEFIKAVNKEKDGKLLPPMAFVVKEK